MQPLSPLMQKALEAVVARERALRSAKPQDASQPLEEVFKAPQSVQ